MAILGEGGGNAPPPHSYAYESSLVSKKVAKNDSAITLGISDNFVFLRRL